MSSAAGADTKLTLFYLLEDSRGQIRKHRFNNELIKENFIITNKVQEIIIPFEQQQGTLKVVAIDEGESESNTVNFILSNNTGLNMNSFISKLKKDELIEISFSRE